LLDAAIASPNMRLLRWKDALNDSHCLCEEGAFAPCPTWQSHIQYLRLLRWKNARNDKNNNMPITPPPNYTLSKDAALEVFDDGGLVLIIPERRLVELNPSAVEILNLLDGTRSTDQVAAEIADTYDLPLEQAAQDVQELCEDMLKSGILVVQLKDKEKEGMTNSPEDKFLCNPDVVLREEDPDEGGLLFNPDTNQVKVINTTGLFIWQQCGVARTMAEIVAEVRKGFDEVPLEEVAADVQEFLDGMLASGFIGTVV